MALNAAALDAAIVATLNRRVVCPTDTELYRVADAFGMDPYWRDHVRSERFSRMIEGGILYQPAIVEDIHGEIVSAFASPVKMGVMIKGSQGIGKSHSLVNTVLKLESSGEVPCHLLSGL
jgi:serine kinase of HPr protein (carbohydrate metabolism regulator)